MTDTYWRLDWRVPAENAIGGASYWHPFSDAQRITTWAEALVAYRKAQAHYGVENVRLVRIDETVEVVPHPHTSSATISRS